MVARVIYTVVELLAINVAGEIVGEADGEGDDVGQASYPRPTNHLLRLAE